MKMTRLTLIGMAIALASIVAIGYLGSSTVHADQNGDALDRELAGLLRGHKFTGRIEEQLEKRLGRKVDAERADLGRFLFFDRLLGVKLDNACAGCHSPLRGFGDSQPMAIGIDNNNLVGPHRTGPRNQRRSPMVLNNAFFPKLMWNSRFIAVSGDPFDNSEGFVFPPPEGTSLSDKPQLLVAQAFIPPTERIEMAGFEFPGNNDDIRAEVIRRLNATPNYRLLFQSVYPDIGPNDPITYNHMAAAIAEFEFMLTFANAPIDRFARGEHDAMTDSEKRGGILFFSKAGCVKCHAVGGQANEMFSDFTPRVLAVPQIAPRNTNATFDGPGVNEDFGLEQVTGNAADRYKFRTSPLRNIALNHAFFHNGAFPTLEEAIAHHLDVRASVANYTPVGRVPLDLQAPMGPMQPVLERLDPLARRPIRLSAREFADLVAFVRTGLLDPRASPENLALLIPETLPSELEPLEFEPEE